MKQNIKIKGGNEVRNHRIVPVTNATRLNECMEHGLTADAGSHSAHAQLMSTCIARHAQTTGQTAWMFTRGETVWSGDQGERLALRLC